MPGPPPKRESQRRRNNKPKVAVEHADSGELADDDRKPNGNWHPTALRWFESLTRSGQAKYYEPSDWAAAYFLAESMSAEMRTGEAPRASVIAAITKGMTGLLVFEADRRRVALELSAPSSGAEEADNVTDISSWTSRLDGTG